MSQACAISKCERTSRALCDCCLQNLCLQHLNEHNTALLAQLNPLTDEINTLGDRLNRIDLHESGSNCRQKLEQWRLDSHQKIDRLFEKKCQELDSLISRKIDKQKQKVLEIHTQLGKLIRDQEATRKDIDRLTSTISDVKDAMNKVNRACFVVEILPLLIDDSLVQIKEKCGQEFDPSCFNTIFETIVCPAGSSRALAANDRYLLIHQKPNLSFVDASLTIAKQVLWPYDSIRDMTWSSMLDRFIVVAHKTIYLVDGNTMSIDSVPIIEQRLWSSCTCSDDRLFLSTYASGSTIIEISLSPSIIFAKEWKPPITCTMNETISDIVYNNERLATVIRNKVETSIRVDLRCCKTLDCLWSLPLDVTYNENYAVRCCSLGYNGWLLGDYNAECFLHVTTDGKLKTEISYKGTPYRVICFGVNMIAVVTNSAIKFHQI